MTVSTNNREHHRLAEFVAGSSRKFYEVKAVETENGATVTLKWGRIGTSGQSKVTETYSFGSARNMANEKFAKKLAKGYREVSPLELLARACEEDETEIQENAGLGLSEITVPTRWAMFTAAGNRRLTKLAQKFADKLDRLRTSYSSMPFAAYCKQGNALLKQYVREWERIGNGKSYGEASDTAVREVVGDFFDTLRAKVGIDSWKLVDWDDVR